MNPRRFIVSEINGAIGSITLNRPEVLNSFNRAMALELQDVLREYAESDAVRVVLIAGAGRGFCAGQDLGEFAPDGSTPKNLAEVVRTQFNPIVRLLHTMEKPVVCVLNGIAAGAGANIALSCDFIIASENASFAQSFSKVGLIPDSGGTYILPRLVGYHRAARMTMLGEKLPVPEAYALGLVFMMVSDSHLAEAAASFAAHLATLPTKALGLTKRALHESWDNTFEEQLNLEASLQEEAGLTEDFAEGVRAFLEKRKPGFIGR